jgi:hypothetical protein
LQKAAVLELDGICFFQRPSFAGLFMHQLNFDRIQVELGNRFEFGVRDHGVSLVLAVVICDVMSDANAGCGRLWQFSSQKVKAKTGIVS